MKRYSKKVREEAAIALSICASDRACRQTYIRDVLGGPEHYGPVRLAMRAFGHVSDYDIDMPWPEHYAEAEALIRCGWSPGDEP